jgi:hypothetical protein
MSAVPLALGCFLVAIKEIFSPTWEARDKVVKAIKARAVAKIVSLFLDFMSIFLFCIFKEIRAVSEKLLLMHQEVFLLMLNVSRSGQSHQ